MTARDRARFRPEGKRPSARRGYMTVPTVNGPAVSVPVEKRRGVWALHRSVWFYTEPALHPTVWTVTHVPSKRAALLHASRAEADRVFAALCKHMPDAALETNEERARAMDLAAEKRWRRARS